MWLEEHLCNVGKLQRVHLSNLVISWEELTEQLYSRYPPPSQLPTTLPVPRNFVTSRCSVVLRGASLSGFALLNASRTAAFDFSVK
jgi:hypothetical protein